ncbi:hypothetical protein C8R44DRAFT_877753 [Mycena epipterygia]|nr:hypothetical protein C8R44DRAFT_877753 [Mycena epipterygia]
MSRALVARHGQDASDKKNHWISKNAENVKMVIFLLHVSLSQKVRIRRRISKQAKFLLWWLVGTGAGEKKQQQAVTRLVSHHHHRACIRMAHRDRRLCQELIELILDSADKETLKSCALVARLFRPPSQKLIFSDLTILPSRRHSIPALQRLADVLSASPHLAVHVRMLHLVQPGFYEPCMWMQSDILPAILSAFTNLKSLKVRVYDWDFFHLNCEQAIYALITRALLSSIELKGARLETNARLLSLLRCLPASLESASFLDVFAGPFQRSARPLPP